jgi:hypothetical protein
VKPDVILGLSAVGGLFSKEVRVLAYESQSVVRILKHYSDAIVLIHAH